jgi:hypothetical protein
MGDASIYPDTLELIIPPGVRVKVADIIVSEPIEQDGLEYQTITLTAPFRGVHLGMALQVVDAAENDKLICGFMPEKISMFFRGEQFMRIDGKHYLRLPESQA